MKFFIPKFIYLRYIFDAKDKLFLNGNYLNSFKTNDNLKKRNMRKVSVLIFMLFVAILVNAQKQTWNNLTFNTLPGMETAVSKSTVYIAGNNEVNLYVVPTAKTTFSSGDVAGLPMIGPSLLGETESEIIIELEAVQGSTNVSNTSVSGKPAFAISANEEKALVLHLKNSEGKYYYAVLVYDKESEADAMKVANSFYSK